MLDGRVKTLHPKVHGGILHIRDNPQHRAAVAEHGIQPIDMVVVNLYAFEKTASKPGVEFHDIIENIDIGGPSMVRSAAKNFQDVAIVTSPVGLRSDRSGNAGKRGIALAARPSGGWRRKPSPLRRLTIRRLPRRWSASLRPRPLCLISVQVRIFRQRCACRSTRRLICATARTRTRKPRSTATARAKAWPTASNFRARNSATTTSSTCRPRGTLPRNLQSRSSPSSSTPTPAARPWLPHCQRPTSARWSAIRSRRSAA